MRVFWLNLLPTGGAQPNPNETHAGRAQNFCRERSVLGMGWSVNATDGELLSWDDYLTRREDLRKEYGNYDPRRNVDRWKEEVRVGDLVWTKITDRQFWLSRITGDWHYDSSASAKEADMVNQRPVMITAIPFGDVPPEVAEHSNRLTLHQMGRVDLPLEKSGVAEAANRYPDLLPKNLADYCALWQTLRGANSG